ncbi:membrane fusion protein, multidrug efflux system [Albimonas donghaensis]|uniref:Membrane fusion protein, multidrug efflux system n=1 Tax=Albimonas donghaensis TaxID=356660 RepID=A0A1H3BX77_9RHOB|nr:efflux RND transporter periplasmic adaptor subunit [Albimonas donghaensis]SDX46391.1 membrane fusion protein, multidrug efflux system [Albimonas donghaensis]
MRTRLAEARSAEARRGPERPASLSHVIPARRALLAAAAVAMATLAAPAGPALAQAGPPAGAGSGPMEVGVIEMRRESVPRVFTLPGRAVAYEQVDIRPRVDGVITEILFDPGKPLSVGDPLYRLDAASYEADVASAEADLASAEAALPTAQAAYDRAVKLEGSGVTASEVEEARSALAQAKATLNAAGSALKYARTRLGWTLVAAPIRGLAEVSSVSVGDLVTAAQSDAMTTVTRLDPVDVVMLEPSARILSVRRQIEDGVLTPNEKLGATLRLENGELYAATGALVAPSATVSTTTGTVSIRFRFDNPEGRILPGMFVRGEVELGRIEAFLLPQRAASMGDDGRLTAYLAGEDGAARLKVLDTLGAWSNAWIVTEGLEDGDLLIVDGLKTMRAGLAVTPVAAEIDADGMVRDLDAAADDDAADAPTKAATE